MGLLYLEEHLGCINYDRGENPIMELVSVVKDKSWEDLPLGNKLVFLLKGKVLFSLGRFTDYPVNRGQILYLPTDYGFICKAKENSTLLVMHIQGYTRFCDDYHFKDLEKNFANVPKCSESNIMKPAVLEINEAIEKYLESLLKYMDLGAKCKSFYQIKIKELFYIFRWFYPKETLMEFFQCALKGGDEFAGYIMNDGHKYKSVGELAEAMNYTVSGFEKRFKRVFGISPYKWMMNQKAERIFHQVRTTDLTFKQICSDFGFTSLSRFNDFCKNNFGKPPGDIRGNNKIGGNPE